MSHININLNEVETASGEPHPEGLLAVQVKKAELRDTKAGDSKYINWQLSPTQSENRRPVFLRTSLKPEALWNLKLFLTACGFQWQSDGTFNLEDVLGSECRVSVSLRQLDDGRKDNEVGPPYYAAG